jgi:sodium pump decarboxylase gamma subunit
MASYIRFLSTNIPPPNSAALLGLRSYFSIVTALVTVYLPECQNADGRKHLLAASTLGSTDTFDQNLLNDGLTVSLVGMGIVFAVLALLALSIKAISLLDREPSAITLVAETHAATPAEPAGAVTGQQVAAIAVAMALSEPRTSMIPASLSKAGSTAGSWLQSGRMRVLGSGSRARRN